MKKANKLASFRSMSGKGSANALQTNEKKNKNLAADSGALLDGFRDA